MRSKWYGVFETVMPGSWLAKARPKSSRSIAPLARPHSTTHNEGQERENDGLANPEWSDARRFLDTRGSFLVVMRS